MAYEIKPGDVAIILSPLEEGGTWTGNITTSIAFGKEHQVEAMRASMDLAITMAAAERFLEECPENIDIFDEIRAELVEELFPEQYAEAEKELEEDEVVQVEGNVYKLNRWSKTKGTA